ncbi:MAG: glycosyltransferase family 4 protein [Myxococcota bacterium]
MKRLALVSPYLPGPAGPGGRVRTHILARAAAERFDLHLFAAAHPREVERAGAELEHYAQVTVAKPRVWRSPRSQLPWRARGSAGIERAFRNAHAEQPFDGMWVEQALAAPLALQSGLRWLLDEHHLESAVLEATLNASGKAGRVERREISAMAALEARAWDQAQELVCATDGDAAAVAVTRTGPITVVPNGVDVEGLPFRRPSARTGADVLFMGAMNHPPHEEAAAELAREIMPRVWKDRPEARLVLSGANPSRRVRRLAHERVEVTGAVDRPGDYLEKARVFAHPLRRGRGAFSILLGALASGLPLVSTELGLRALELSGETPILRAESPEAFAAAILTVLSGPAEADAEALNGRGRAEARSWDALGQGFVEVLERWVEAT